MENGIDKLRINPGKLVLMKCNKSIQMAKEKYTNKNRGKFRFIRKEILKKYGSPTADAMLESAMYHIGLLEK